MSAQSFAPAVVPLIALRFGWQAAFIATGLAGLVWVLFWWPIYRRPQEHPRLSADELAYIESDPVTPVAKIPWRQLLPYRQTWAFAIGKFLTDPVWWFYLFWFAPFMKDRFEVDIKSIGTPMVTVYVLATVGSVAGGWLSSSLIRRGWSVNAARKTAMLIFALCVVPVAMAPLVETQWIAVALVGMAAAAHQAFSANLFTLASDMFPKPAVGSVVGIGTFAGALLGAVEQIGCRLFEGPDGKLRRDVRHRRFGLPHRIDHHPDTCAPDRASESGRHLGRVKQQYVARVRKEDFSGCCPTRILAD